MKILPLVLSLSVVVSCASDDADKTGAEPSVSTDGLVDADGDGVLESLDCDDADPTVFPGAPERCNDVDDDCDGTVDEDPADGAAYYYDGDADGYGIGATELIACAAPEGFAAVAGDCNDANAAVHPDAPEDDCTDPVDYNCDGSVGYADADGDGSPACEDCNDANEAIHPGQDEVCNDGIDDDCDGAADGPGSVGETTWYADADGDLHGDPAAPLAACDQPAGYVGNATDCNDESAAANPSGVEVCDGLDNDCNGEVDGDGAIGAVTLYRDADGDGVGVDTDSTFACDALDGYASVAGDCDDGSDATFPGAAEVCDGVDNNCSGVADDGLATETYYADPDDDGYGLTLVAVESCSAIEGYATTGGDCDESDDTVNPGALEVCDGLDNNCSGVADDGLPTEIYYADPDGDGYGLTAVAIESCAVPTGYSLADGDCSEGDSAINPGAAEVCDGVDNDCSGGADEGLTTVFYADADGDGVGVESDTIEACAVPVGYAASFGDCKPADGSVHPGAAEVCDGADNDCDTEVDDADADLDLTTATAFYFDGDDDSYGAGAPVYACSAPDDHTTDNTDCLDTDRAAHPGAAEVWYDGVDQDCAGDSDYDADADGYDAIEFGGLDEDDADSSCVTDCFSGLTEDDPGDSCAQLASDFPDLPNDWYWIAPEGTAFEAYCDIENGGWTQCFELVNTPDEDLEYTDPGWFDSCIDYTSGSWTGTEVRVTLLNSVGMLLYDEEGSRSTTWSYENVTSSVAASNQYNGADHEARVLMSNGDELAIPGRNADNVGCHGSLGSGYAVLVYPSGPSNPGVLKMLVAPYRQMPSYETGAPRHCSGWSTEHEVSYDAGTMDTCRSTTSQLGTFAFWVR